MKTEKWLRLNHEWLPRPMTKVEWEKRRRSRKPQDREGEQKLEMLSLRRLEGSEGV